METGGKFSRHRSGGQRHDFAGARNRRDDGVADRRRILAACDYEKKRGDNAGKYGERDGERKGGRREDSSHCETGKKEVEFHGLWLVASHEHADERESCSEFAAVTRRRNEGANKPLNRRQQWKKRSGKRLCYLCFLLLSWS
jgi:hypothetical protein